MARNSKVSGPETFYSIHVPSVGALRRIALPPCSYGHYVFQEPKWLAIPDKRFWAGENFFVKNKDSCALYATFFSPFISSIQIIVLNAGKNCCQSSGVLGRWTN